MVPLLPVYGVPAWFLRLCHWWCVRDCRKTAHDAVWVIERSIIACGRCGVILDADPDASRYHFSEPE